MKNILLIIIFIAIPILSFANDGSYSTIGYGGAVFPVKNNAITMDEEEIRINIRVAELGIFEAEYDCTFYFTNTMNEAQTVLIGFPHRLDSRVRYDFDHDKRVSTPTESSVEDFIFYVDGKEKPFDPMPAKNNPDLQEVPAYDVIYTIEVGFEPKEKKILENSFKIKLFLEVYPSPMMPPPKSWKTINYILKSGLTWKEPIGIADIWISFDVPRNYLAYEAHPLDYKTGENPDHIHYHYEAFTPNEDISVIFNYKKMPFDYSLNQIRDFIDKKDFINAYYLILKLDALSMKDQKDEKTKDALRILAYKTAEHFYRTDQDKSIGLYMAALHNCYSFAPDMFFDLRYPGDATIRKLADWKHEKEDKAPCYYIAYNLACIYSMKGDLSSAERWYEIAQSMNSRLRSMAYKDNDMEYLLKGKKENIIKPKDGKTDLMKELEKYHPADKATARLIESSDDINAKDKDGKTALMYAAFNTYGQKAIQGIIAKGGSVNTTDKEGKTPIMWACRAQYTKEDTLRLLIEAGAKLNVQDKKGKTAIIYYLEAEKNLDATTYKAAVQYLLRSGADPGIRDNRGFNAFDVANRKKKEYVFETNYVPYLKDIDGKTVLISSRDPDVERADIKDSIMLGDRLFILYEWGWIALDISALPKLKLIDEYYRGHEDSIRFGKIALIGNYLYIASFESGRFEVFDVTGIKHLEQKTVFTATELLQFQPVKSILVSGDYKFVSMNELSRDFENRYSNEERIVCYSLKDKKNPRRISFLKAFCGKLYIYQNYLLLNNGRLLLIDISDPMKMRILSSTETPISNSVSFFTDIYTDGNLIFFPHDSNIAVYTMEPGWWHSPRLILIQDLSPAENMRPGNPTYISGYFLKDNIAYLDKFGSLIDFSNPAKLKPIKPETDEHILNFEHAIDCGDYLISFPHYGEIHVYDVQNPLKPFLVKKYIRRR